MYEKVPIDFDQQAYYIVQREPEDKGDNIYLGIEIRELNIFDEDIEDETMSGEPE